MQVPLLLHSDKGESLIVITYILKSATIALYEWLIILVFYILWIVNVIFSLPISRDIPLPRDIPLLVD